MGLQVAARRPRQAQSEGREAARGAQLFISEEPRRHAAEHAQREVSAAAAEGGRAPAQRGERRGREQGGKDGEAGED